VLAESILKHLVEHSHPAVLGIPDTRCLYLAINWIQPSPSNQIHRHWNTMFAIWVKTISGVRNASTCTILISFSWIKVDFLIQWTCKTWVYPPWRLCADTAGSQGSLSNNVNSAAPSCQKTDQDALNVSSVFEMYSATVMCLLWEQDFFWVTCGLWLPCHLSEQLWTLAIRCNYTFSASHIISQSYSAFIVFYAVPSLANIPLLAWTNCLITTFS
jgi:hypothetical protein